MNTEQLKCAINCDTYMKKYIIGVFARDQIPHHVLPTPYGYIVNTDKSDQQGTHWLAVYVESSTKMEFFDSYGHSPQFYNFDHKMLYNTKKLQSVYTNVCGHYCLFYLANRCRNISLKDIVHTFSSDYTKNDYYVSAYIENVFPFCFSTSNFVSCQSCCSQTK